MEVLILRTWLRNIGNGFIDKGAKIIIEKAFPKAEIYEVSGFPNKAAEKIALGPLAGGVWRRLGDPGQQLRDYRLENHPARDNMVNISEFLDVDLAVLPGCVLYDVGLEPYFETLLELQQRKIPLIILGAGGGDYKPETREYVHHKLDQLEPCGLISRDTPTFEYYQDAVDTASNGIDCAFFINEWYSPPQCNKEFTVATFDKIEQPPIESNNRTIRPDHTPFGRSKPFESLVKNVIDRIQKRGSYKSEDVFVSDLLSDYLFFYANARVTHSDRIHACVPTLAYGNKARFHFDTPRGALFKNAGLGAIGKELVEVNEVLEEKKEQQVEELKRQYKKLS